MSTLHSATNTQIIREVHAFSDRRTVRRDLAHLAMEFRRCLNIPARYYIGHLRDIGVPADASPMDFGAWFEVFLGARWPTFDAR
jgi:transglutaminase-like putative cysteine protease